MEPKVLYPHSQTHVLQQRLKEAGVRHGADVRADLEFDIMADRGGPTVFFCSMTPDSILVRNFARRGDGGELPVTVNLNGFRIPGNLGFASCRVENARVITNGLILIEADRRSKVTLTDVEYRKEERLATAT